MKHILCQVTLTGGLLITSFSPTLGWGNVTQEDNKITEDKIPVDGVLTNLEYFVPMVGAKAHLDAAHTILVNKDKAAAENYLEAVDNALGYTEVELPLAATEHHVVTTQKLLMRNKPQKEDVAIEDAEAGVEFISLSVKVPPIGPAKKSLWQGMEAFAAGNVEDGKTDLKQADVWLTRAVQTRDEEVKAEATTIEGELSRLPEKTTQKGPAIEIALHGLWQKTTALTEREAVKAVVGWQNLRKQTTTHIPLQNMLKLKVDLTDAKFHLTYAEIFEFITHEENKAQMAIEKAQMHLGLAEKLANGRFKIDIEDL